MKKILLFGAGKSATVLIRFLLENAEAKAWKICIADAQYELAKAKTNNHPNARAVQLDILDAVKRKELIATADLVISMMPPALHEPIAFDCLELGKHLLTASYASPEILALHEQVKSKQLLFLCEMGLDPGIDHMSALQLLNNLKEQGASIRSFKSHCGGLIAPESDTNSWHYKITWNPRNIVLAGQAGATYKVQGEIIKESYEQLFNPSRLVTTGVTELPQLAYYPNRDSLSYIRLYGMETADTFIRTTLRHQDFIVGWQVVTQMNLASDTPVYDTTALSPLAFLKQQASATGTTPLLQSMLQVDKQIDQNDLPSRELLLAKQFKQLGLLDDEKPINKGFLKPLEILQWAMENSLALAPNDHDLIVMIHEIDYVLNGRNRKVQSTLYVKGEDPMHTAMAKTVGLPLGIAADLILSGKLTSRGVQIPVLPEIYNPVLNELVKYGISFTEKLD